MRVRSSSAVFREARRSDCLSVDSSGRRTVHAPVAAHARGQRIAGHDAQPCPGSSRPRRAASRAAFRPALPAVPTRPRPNLVSPAVNTEVSMKLDQSLVTAPWMPTVPVQTRGLPRRKASSASAGGGNALPISPASSICARAFSKCRDGVPAFCAGHESGGRAPDSMLSRKRRHNAAARWTD